MFQNKIQKSNLILMLTITAFIIFSGCDVHDNESLTKNTIDSSINTRTSFDGSSYTLTNGENFYVHYTVADERWKSISYNDIFTEVALVGIQTREEGDPCGIRIKDHSTDGFKVKIEEEKSNDSETGHRDELIGILRIKTPNNSTFVYDVYDNIVAMRKTAWGSQKNHDQWNSISIPYSFNDPVVFAYIDSYNGSDPCHIRIRNVKSNSFEFKIEEWEYLWDEAHNYGKHCDESVSFLIVEKGSHLMGYEIGEYRIKWEVGTKNVSRRTWNRNMDITLEHYFRNYGYPFVFTQCQTANDSTPVVIRSTQPRIDYGSPYDPKRIFSIRMQEEEANDQYHGSETIGYMVIGDIGPNN